jgi:serine/threonine protein kinase
MIIRRREADRHVATKRTKISVRPDGTLEIDGGQIAIPNVFLRKEIGRGANGIVLLGTNQVLDREVAVKLWVALRDSDNRDKYKQGIAEVRKAALSELPFTPRIFDAGGVGQQIYVAMEYFDGQSLKDWLKVVSPEFAWRYVIAYKIDRFAHELAHRGLIHGDLHWGNVLVHNRHESLPQFKRDDDSEVPVFSMMEMNLELKIIDFGTSYFSKKGFSIARHWRVYEELIDKLLWPIEMRCIWNHTKPADWTDARKMADWFSEYLFWMYWILMHAFECDEIRPLWNSDFIIQGQNAQGPFQPSDQDYPIVTAEGHMYLRDLINRHQLTLHDVEMMRPWMTMYWYIHSGML